MRSRLKVLKDSGYLLFARTFARLSTLPFLIYAASKLGPSLYGILLFVTASIEVLSSFSSLGVQRYGARAVVRKEIPRDHLATILLLLRLTISTFLAACAVIAILVFPPTSPKLEVLLLGLVAMVFSSFIEMTETMFTGLGKFGVSATMQVIGRTVYLLFGFIALDLGLSVIAVMAAFVAGVVAESAIRIVYTLRNVTPLTVHFSRNEMIAVFIGMLPFAVTAIASMIYYRVDALILDFSKGDEAVGIYGAAYSFYSFFVWVPIVLSRALLPGLTAQFQHDPQGAEGTCWFWYRIVGVASIPVIFVSTLLAGPVIRNLLPASYATSVVVLQILLWSIPSTMMLSVGYILLTVADKEVRGARLTIGTAVIIFILDLLLIPPYSVNGAAVAMVVATVIWGVRMHRLLSRFVFTREHSIIRTFSMPVLSCALMVAIAVALWPLGLVISLMGGLLTYGVTASMVRLVENKYRAVRAP